MELSLGWQSPVGTHPHSLSHHQALSVAFRPSTLPRSSSSSRPPSGDNSSHVYVDVLEAFSFGGHELSHPHFHLCFILCERLEAEVVGESGAVLLLAGLLYSISTAGVLCLLCVEWEKYLEAGT